MLTIRTEIIIDFYEVNVRSAFRHSGSSKLSLYPELRTWDTDGRRKYDSLFEYVRKEESQAGRKEERIGCTS